MGVVRRASAEQPAPVTPQTAGAAQQPARAVQQGAVAAQQAGTTQPASNLPYEMAPVAPQVTYSGGQLTISAPNSTLSDILDAVKKQTGAKVELPESASQERVAIQLGPGNPRDVLSQLLHGSPFDYILLGSDQDPNAVTQILLTRREGSATPASARIIPNQSPMQPEPVNEEAEAEAAPAQAVPQPAPGITVRPGQPFSTPPTMQQPEQTAPGAQADPGTTALPGQGNQVKTPEQLLQELRRMQQQEQQRRQRPPE